MYMHKENIVCYSHDVADILGHIAEFSGHNVE